MLSVSIPQPQMPVTIPVGRQAQVCWEEKTRSALVPGTQKHENGKMI